MTGVDLATVLGEERRIMNLYAPHYDAATLTNSYVYRIERSAFVGWMAAMLHREGRDLGALSLLDVGCSTGNMIDLLSQAGFTRLTGIDVADRMLAEARRRRPGGAAWVQGTVEDPPFGDATFDVIVAVFTLHHLYDLGAFFRLVDRVLRPDGWFFVLEYDDSRVADHARRAGRRALGDVVRGVFARKNRRTLAMRPVLPVLANPAHRTLAPEDIRRAVPASTPWELRHESRGILLPALLPVLVEESAVDRAIARIAGAADRRLERRFGGLFQRIAGRRRS